MKKYFFLIVLCFIMLIIPNTYASNSYVTIHGSAVNCRSGAGTNYESLGGVTNEGIYYLAEEEIIPDVNMNGSCDGGWYHIKFKEATGYVCSSYANPTIIKIEENLTCEEELHAKEFPDDYIKPLCELKSLHPNWTFMPIQTGLDFSTSVTKESACGKSYIATSNTEYIDSSCKNQYKKTWYPASQKAVAYYMDPRNWFTEQYIFQFNTNKYEEALAEFYPTLARNSISGTDFYQYHLGINNDLANIISEAGSNTGISPIFLSSRMTQELGSGTSERDLYSGTYTGHDSAYLNLYNFFNIGVSDSCATKNGTAYCGLLYAKNAGWTSPLLAIEGGSKEISKSYINVGQYTTYFQKFNLTPTNKNSTYTHQYMTNVAAPSSESKTAYNTYKKANVLDAAFVFYIPIFNDMGVNISNSAGGASGEDPNKDKSTAEIATIVTSAGYKYSTNVISGVNPNLTVADFKGTIEGIAGAGNVRVYDASGSETLVGSVGTGFKVNITNSSESKTLTIVIKGDTSGDGVVNALDLLQVQKSILGNYNLSDAYFMAGDTSGDGVVNALDLLQIQKDILGTFDIVQ